MMKQKTDRQYWYLFAIVGLCGAILPCALTLIWESADFYTFTSTEELTGIRLWWMEHNVEVLGFLQRFAFVMKTAAVLILAYRYRLALYAFAVLPTALYMLLEVVMTSIRNAQGITDAAYWNLVLLSNVINILFIPILLLIYFAIAQLRRVGVGFPLYAAIGLVGVWLGICLETVVMASGFAWAYWLQLLLQRIPIYVVALGLYFLFTRAESSTERKTLE